MRTQDGRPARDAAYFSAEELSRNMHRTNEGYLLCLGVPIARTGRQLYHEQDGLPVTPNSGGEIVVDRDPDEVFRPETVASFNGKPVTLDHPMVDDPGADGWDVHPGNVEKFEVGTVLNPRRGDGDDQDKVLADLLIKRQDAIDAVLSGKRQVSCGYDAQYETLSPGHGRQRNIIGNHVALVDMARCGPVCSIQDSSNGEIRMTANTATAKSGDRWSRFMDAIRGAARRNDPAAVDNHLQAFRDELVSGGEGGDKTEHHMHVHLPQTGEPPTQDGEEDDPMEQLTGKNKDGLVKLIKDAAGKAAARAVRDALKSAGLQLRDAEREEDEGEGEDEDEDMRDGRREEDGDDETRDGGIFAGEVDLEDPAPDATGVRIRGPRYAETTPVARDGRRRRAKTGDGHPLPRLRVRDSAHLEGNFRDVVARAEMLLPGVRVPTWDAARSAVKTLDAMCAFRRNVLAGAWKTQDGREAIAPVMGTSNTRDDIAPLVSRMTCDAVLTLFNGATEIARRANNYAPVRSPSAARTGDSPKPPSTIAEVNKANRSYWKQPAR